MRKWIIWAIIILVLAAAGFCIYWFCFRDTSDGGKLSNKEVLFAVQSVLENEGTNLEDIVKDHQKVTYSSSQITEMFVSADGSEKLSDKFASDLVIDNGKNLALSRENFENLFSGTYIHGKNLPKMQITRQIHCQCKALLHHFRNQFYF